MDILFAGNTGAVSGDFYDAIGKEYRCVVLRNDSAKEHKNQKKKRLVFFQKPGEEDIERIFGTYDFRMVVFFSQVIDGEKKIFDELEKLEYILYLSRKKGISSFIYITGNRLPDSEENGEASRVVLLNACEQLCKKAADNDGIRVQLLRVPYLYHCVIRTSHVGRWMDTVLSGRRLSFPGYEDTMTDFLREDDLARLLNRMFDDPWDEAYLDTRLGGNNNYTFAELAGIFKRLAVGLAPEPAIIYTGKDECTPTYQEDRWARNEYGWIPRGNLEEDLNDAAQRYKKEKESRRKKPSEGFFGKRIVRVTMEQLVLFIAAEILNYMTRDNVMFNFLDFRLVYIAIIACINGLGAGAAAGIISSAGYIAANASAASWQVIFYNVQNWLPFACYMLLGCVLGYTIDKANDEIKSRTKELELLEGKYAFLHSLYTEVAEGKERFNNQIIGYKDSFGKMYSVVKKLNTTLPEMVFYEAIDIMEEILDNSYVAIYSIQNNSSFARLYVCSKRCAGSIHRSIKMTDYKKLMESLNRNDTFVNREALENYPAYATPIRRDGELVGMILIMEADYKHMNMEFSNKLRIMSDMIQDSLVRAMEFHEMNNGVLENTRILENERFEEILEVKRQMKKKQYLDYVMLKIESDGKDIKEQNRRLGRLVRENDVLGMGKDGGLYLLLSQTGRGDMKAISDRLIRNNIRFEEVRE